MLIPLHPFVSLYASVVNRISGTLCSIPFHIHNSIQAMSFSWGVFMGSQRSVLNLACLLMTWQCIFPWLLKEIHCLDLEIYDLFVSLGNERKLEHSHSFWKQSDTKTKILQECSLKTQHIMAYIRLTLCVKSSWQNWKKWCFLKKNYTLPHMQLFGFSCWPLCGLYSKALWCCVMHGYW
jgi:hypothetical protein